mmetsp:Transcript_26737/g.44726  ORF Transcript_26737/g.44726 Transcript_26737/m.44726 type:complete len:198 (+) Transcript_26737:72-665(+)
MSSAKKKPGSPKGKGGKGGKGSPKKKQPDVPGEIELTLEEKYQRSQLKIEALEHELVTRNEQTLRAVTAQNELKAKVADSQREIEDEKQNMLDITSDMTRQYKAMQETLMSKNNALEQQIQEMRDQLDLARVALEEFSLSKQTIIEARDRQIAEQKQKMEEMASEFSEMLRQTLDKMSQRIDVVSAAWETDIAGKAA